MPEAMAVPTEDFRDTYKRLKGVHRPGVSLEDIYFEARQAMAALGQKAASLSSVQKAIAPGSGRNNPSVEVLETVALGLGVQPEEFADYRLALARASLDAEEVGWEVALRNLAAYEKAGPSPAEIRRARTEAIRFAERDAERVARKRRKKS